MQQIAQAQRRIAKICRRLERPEPESLDRCGPDLEKLIGDLRQLESERGRFAGSDPAEDRAFAGEVRKLRQEVSKAMVLVEAAGKFYAGWAGLVALRTEEDQAGGYTSSGANVTPIDRGTVVMHG
jgi:hypothetical protein